MDDETRWAGLRPEARQRLNLRNYSSRSVEERLPSEGLEAGTALASQRVLQEAEAWIPGVELIARQVHAQRHRGYFSEMGREGAGRLGNLGLWPRQWAAAKMFAGSAKGFHIHPPYIPAGESAEVWLAKLYGHGAEALPRPYDQEQWDVMYFLQGRLDLILCDERAGLPRRRMRLFIDGDDRCGPNNIAIVIPPGVAHALRAEGSEDLVMVYGTSTTFTPEFEGRIASSIESLPFPPEWDTYLGNSSK